MNTAEDFKHQASLWDLLVGLVDLPAKQQNQFNVLITGVKMDSRQVQTGDLFIACFGRHHDARDYIDAAIKSGAVAVLAESSGNWQSTRFIRAVPIIAIDNLSAKISEIAGRFYGHPSKHLKMVGITGTNGKTSCSHFMAQALAELGFRCGVIGTLGYGQPNQLVETIHTTPDAVFTQRVLATMRKEGIDSVAMEVSSVGLHQHRVKAIDFDIAVFTNLTRDHLDYHDSMEAYADSKRKLFTCEALKAAVINLDDPYALVMLNSCSRNVEILTYSIHNSIASVHACSLDLNRHGYKAEIVTPLGAGSIEGQLIGQFNFSNVLAVVAALCSYQIQFGSPDLALLLKTVSTLKPVNGRMEIIGSSDEITAIVDYAHTPDGLKSSLSAIRSQFEGNVWCVFGCGGNRDRGKRPMMGEIAESFANKLIIADDNPRKERGEDIVQHILSGISDKSKVSVIRDRAQAIDHAILNASPGDVVIVAGKGHETYQDIDGKKSIFSDASQIRLALQKRKRNRA